MTQLTSGLTQTSARLAVAAILVVCALPAVAQTQPPAPEAPAPIPHATSSLEATAPTLSEQRETRALVTAVFARPAAAARAADTAVAASQPALSPVQPKPEWSASDGVRLGGKGLELTAPF